MTETDMILDYAKEREILTLEYVLAISNLYSHEVNKIKQVIQERIDKVVKEIK